MKNDRDVIIYSSGLAHCSVCALKNLSEKEVTNLVNLFTPTGLKGKWKVSDQNFRSGEPNPCPCNSEPDTRVHYLFSC